MNLRVPAKGADVFASANIVPDRLHVRFVWRPSCGHRVDGPHGDGHRASVTSVAGALPDLDQPVVLGREE